MSRSWWRIPPVVLALVAVVGTLVPSQDEAANPRRFALVVGINDYQSRNLGTLRFAGSDANGMGDVLEKAGFAVTRMTSNAPAEANRPTRANLLRELDRILKVARKGDIVIIVLAGHGLQFEGEADSYFCPSDARPDPKEKATMLALGDLYRRMGNSFASCVLLVDACRNDPTVRAGRSRSGLDGSGNVPTGVAALFSCKAGEFAYENKDIGHGVFFFHVIGKLARAVETGEQVDFNGLASDVLEAVPKSPHYPHAGAKQTPSQQGNFDGLLVLLPRSEKAGVKPLPAAARMNDYKIEMARIPGGNFTLGAAKDDPDAYENERPARTVAVAAFLMSRTEVTCWQYDAVRAGDPRRASEKGDDLPRAEITWLEAIEFCNALSGRAGLPNYYAIASGEVTIQGGTGYRLSTEAEWEYACRAGTVSRWAGGAKPAGLERMACFGQTTRQACGKREANAWGLYDLHGNVAEWCWDPFALYQATPYKVPRVVPVAGPKVVRGGSYADPAEACGSPARVSISGTRRGDTIGFRVARSLEEQP